MRRLDADELSLIDGLRNASPSAKEMVLRMARAALAPDPDRREQAFSDPSASFSPKDEKIHHAKNSLKRVEGRAAAGLPVTAAPEEDLCVPVPAKYLSERYFIVQAQGDSMIGAGIDSGDYCVFDAQASVDDGLVVLAQIEGAADQPDVAIKRLYRRGNRVELRSANPAYAPMVFPAGSVSVTGVLAAVLDRRT